MQTMTHVNLYMFDTRKAGDTVQFILMHYQQYYYTIDVKGDFSNNEWRSNQNK